MKTIFKNNIKSVFALLITSLTLLNCSEDSNSVGLIITSISAEGTDINTNQAVTLDLNAATGAVEVPLNATITIELSDAVDVNSVSSTSLKLSLNGVEVATNLIVSGNSIVMDPVSDLDQGFIYDINFENGITSSSGTALTSTARFFKAIEKAYDPFPQSNNLVAWWRFDKKVTPSIGNFVTAYEQVGYDTDRFGNANGAASFGGATEAGNGDVVAFEANDAFISPSITIATWFKIDPADYDVSRYVFGLAAERGYHMHINPNMAIDYRTSHVVTTDDNNHTSWFAITGELGSAGWPVHEFIQDYQGSMPDLIADGEWHQIVMTFDASTSHQSFYVDGTLIIKRNLRSDVSGFIDIQYQDIGVWDGDSPSGLDAGLAFGFGGSPANKATVWIDYATATNTFKGLLDDFRIWNVALSPEDVLLVYNNEKP
ncbi:LamG-like jellyroll fold domain-containing protein [Seonamhaeicola sp.]|uniref:LamG-like jellyroll fold domain-containing protein n=1 Tax=Seonamhaeicola sp. TaxID=1912245 RepID=UPI0026367EFA|nr:LamG-like jellyroll fold domain-containing protein [Seonamhaeicola sp.]